MSVIDRKNYMSVQVKYFDDRYKTGEWVTAPKTAGSAGIDLYASIKEPVEIAPGETLLIKSGISIYLEDPNYVGLIFPRSGLGTNKGIVLGNLTGVIDSDFQGEMGIPVWNRNVDKTVTISPGDRIAQYVVVPCVGLHPRVVEEFETATVRGAGGFGHSGING